MRILSIFALVLSGIVPAFEGASAALLGPEMPAVNIRQALRRDFIKVRLLAEEMLKQCPPDDCLLVGIGRSPTPLIAMIQAMLGPEAAMNIPRSDLRLLEPPDSEVIAAGEPAGREARSSLILGEAYGRLHDEKCKLEVYTPQNLKRFREHVGHFLESAAPRIGVRRVMIVDWADRGRTAINFNREFPQTPYPYEFLALTHSHSVQDKLSGNGIRSLVVSHHYREIFELHEYRNLAEYDQWSVRPPARQPMIPYTPPQPVTLAEKQRRFQDFRNSIFWAGGDHERWVRRRKKALDREYEALESYYELREAFRRKLTETHPTSLAKRLMSMCGSLLGI